MKLLPLVVPLTCLISSVIALGTNKGAVDAEPLSEEEIEEVWRSGTVQDMHDVLGCISRRPFDLRIHNQTTWDLLRDTYRAVVPPEDCTIEETSLENTGVGGYHVPVEVDYTPYGRGIFTTAPVEEGTVVWRSRNTARFTRGEDYRLFIRTLPVELACDVLYWAYTRAEFGRYVACVDLDAGSFQNDCDVDFDCNVKVSDETRSYTGCELEFRAFRDIVEGEEVKIDYGFSEGGKGWAALGLQRQQRRQHQGRAEYNSPPQQDYHHQHGYQQYYQYHHQQYQQYQQYYQQYYEQD